MNSKQKNILLLIFLIILLFAINYSYLDKAFENFLTDHEISNVKRVIDGDTIVIENNTHVRLLGINTPEHGEKYYQEAKDFLNEKILNKTIELEFGKNKKDRYGRVLAYVFLDNKNINLELVKNGFANIYFPSGKDQHYIEFKNAWNNCIKNKINLCEPSIEECSICIQLNELNYKTQEVVFYNKCDFNCDLSNWKIKDEGRKNFVFPEFILPPKSELKIIVGNKTSNKKELFWTDEDYVWTKTGDSLFLRDSEGRLVLWRSY